MIYCLRVVLPPFGYLAAFAVLYGAGAAFMFWVDWKIGARLPDDVRWNVSRVLMGFGIVGYAIWRTFFFHPIFRPDYKDWLEDTPWTSRKPLPLGPVHLIAQDVLLIGLAMLLTWLIGDPWFLYVPQVFLAAYLVMIGASLFITEAWQWGYAVAFGLGLVIYLWPYFPDCLLVALLTYALAYLGLRQALARFPWPENWITELNILLGRNPQTERGSQNLLGWPYGRLAPRFPGSELWIPLHHALLSSMIVGWWVFAGLSLIPEVKDQRSAGGMVMLFFLWVPIARLGIYVGGYRPPLSLLGRMATFRWIIPGYDQIYVAPLLALVSALSVNLACALLDADPRFAPPLAIAVALSISLGMGPSLKAWRLTGEHRIVEGSLRTGAIEVG